jgi:hypothetical protein
MSHSEFAARSNQVGADMTYEILCKTFDADAKSILEV